MSTLVQKYVTEQVKNICKDYGASEPEQEQTLRDDFTERLTDAFTNFENELLSSNLPLDDMLSIASKVGSTVKKTTAAGGARRGGNGWTLFSKKFTKANQWSKEDTSNAWNSLTKEEKDKYNLEAKLLKDSANAESEANAGTTGSGSTDKKTNTWTGFQKYFKYRSTIDGEKYTPASCSQAYKKLSADEKESYRGWVPPTSQ
jgi:hypothetical protein